MKNEIYDYDADNMFRSDTRKIIRKKTIAHRIVVIGAALLIIAVVCTCVSAAFSFFSSDSESSNSEDQGTVASEGPTQPPTEEPTEPIQSVVIGPSNYTLSDRDDPAYFDNVVFIGDSVSYGMELYVMGERSKGNSTLGNAQFLTSGSLSYANLLWDVSDDSVHPTYNGQKMKLEESLPLIDPDKIYILLGSNDVGIYGIEGSVENAKKMLGNIHNACPDATIIVLSTTPKLKALETAESSLTNEKIDAFNARMSECCPEWGYIWLDFASQFKGEDGGLNPDYCGDPDSMGIHFLASAYKIWVNYFEANKIYPAS